MTRLVEYQDNLFLVTERIKLLEKALALDLDAGIFSRQITQDLEYVSQSLSAIRKQLSLSTHTLQRSENLRTLMLANLRTAETAENLVRKGYIAQGYGLQAAKKHRRSSDELEELLHTDTHLGGDGEQVTREEFEFLLKEEAASPKSPA
jgi:hypothetical protein